MTAIDRINDLLALLPDSEIDDAQKLRKDRQPVKTVKSVERPKISDDLLAA